MIDKTRAWRRLAGHRRRGRDVAISQLFAEDGGRFQRLSLRLDDLLLDFSKTTVTVETMDLLARLAQATGVEERREAMFAGEKINDGEGRSVLHTALRNTAAMATAMPQDCLQNGAPVAVDGVDVMPQIDKTLSRLFSFAEKIRGGKLLSSAKKQFTDVVNIGVGGSDLGAAMATAALRPYCDGPRVHFVSNVDGAHIRDILQPLQAATTLIIISSKTFTTVETMTNAKTAVRWLQKNNPSLHVAAATAAVARAREFGIAEDNIFPFWDFVGGRYSLWSAAGLPLLLALGSKNFADFLRGGFAMDKHFRAAPVLQNIPFVLGLLGVWHRNFCNYPTLAVLPYDERLKQLPAYLQQLAMESNGKSIATDGAPLTLKTAPIVWGATGTNGQHAFFQCLHQGTDIAPCEFIIAANGHEKDLQHHHRLLTANCLAQSRSLMSGGKTKHGFFAGNRPSCTVLHKKLTPFALGRLLALYEHRVFVEGAIWGINSFDQWGVELGKQLATRLNDGDENANENTDGSTRGLLAAIKSLSDG